MILRSIPLAAVVLLVSTRPAVSEPSSSVRFLMNEPASMFDIGMRQLDDYFEGLKSDHQITTVDYDFKSNRIIVDLRVLRDDGEQLAKDLCKHHIEQLKGYLGIEPTGKPLGDTLSSDLELFFSHPGYGNPKEPATLESELDDITVIRVRMMSKPRPVRCESALRSSETLFSG